MTDSSTSLAARSKRVISVRPEIGQTLFNLIVSAYILGVLNRGFWGRMGAIMGDHPGQFVLFSVAIFALTVLTLEFFGPGRLQRPVAALVILMAAGASYYERTFGVLIDREMVRNVFETTVTESRHLITLGAVGTIALTGLVPAALVFWPRIKRVGGWHQLWRWPLGVTLSFAVLVGGLFADFKTFSAILRERKELMASYQPGATIAAIARYGKQQWRVEAATLRPVALDAKPGPRLAAADKPVLLVLFAGETTRAQNFGLNGYVRNTTPGLAARDVVNFPEVASCGTSTAVSLPCMFSPLSQADYSRDAFLGQENLLDVLARAGFAVEWFDNNTGDQKIATRTGWSQVDATLDPEACAVECTDEVFLPLIEKTLATITQDTVLVLHRIGNHGPAYHLRYPRARAGFTPDCQSAEFSRCTTDEIVNAYDNAILQTDYVLSETIDQLAGSDKALTAMLYVSDHGESLGEGGLYLHAAPMFMAPETQTRVPMVLWLSSGFQETMALDPACLGDKATQPTSHDMLFHSVLGLLDVTTTAREEALDVTQGCHNVEAG
jgi:lipid A ethanolaminephosphotransferase